MLTQINDFILKLADPALNWLLALPSDVALILVGVVTGAVITLARPLTTNQDFLRRCSQDKRRLKQLIREAKQGRDKEAIRRYKTTRGMIALSTLKSEGPPLLVAILPIAILGTWCFQRLEFHSPRADETVTLNAYFPISAADGLVHVVPWENDDLVSQNGWVQEIVAVSDPAEGPPHAMAAWHLKAKANPRPYPLQIRYRKGTYTKALLVGQRTYAPPVEFYPDAPQIICAEIELRQVRLFDLVPGIPALHIAPWLVAYFLIAVPSVSLTKRVFRIY